MSHKNFTTRGDEPLEARIVAWVLGEASAFEAEELERLCDEKPELAVFKRRIEAVHGLAGEAHRPRSGADAAWKLSPERRAAVQALIASPDAAAAGATQSDKVTALREAAREQRVQRSGRQAMMAVAACLVLTLVVATLTWPLIMGSGSFAIDKARSLKQEQATIVSYSYEPEESAAAGGSVDGRDVILGKKTRNMVPLSEVAGALPDELIEGTPKPMNVPGLVDPSARPEMRRMAEVQDRKSQSRFADKGGVERGLAAPRVSGERLEKSKADSFSAAPAEEHIDSEVDLAVFEANENAPKRPAAPSASMANTITSSGVHPSPVPVPLGGVQASPSVDFGESEDFGTGWGGGGDLAGMDGNLASLAAKENLKRGREDQKARGNDGEFFFRGTAVEKDATRYARQEPGQNGLELDKLRERATQQAAPRDEAMPTEGLLLAEPGQSSDTVDDQEWKSDATGANQRQLLEKNLALEAGRRQLLEKKLVEASELEVQEELASEKVVKQRPLVTEEETVAAEEPYSTFSLNISDASFRIAQAALAKGEMPDPTAIKVEQFYNAVDYGDAGPAAGMPVASHIEQTAHPLIPGRHLVRIAVKTASEGRNQGQPLRLTLLVDQSGSMAREDRRQAMVDALKGLHGLLTERDQVHVIGFARTPRLLAEALPGNQGAQLSELINIEANEGGTNLEEAIKLGEQLAERHQLEGAQNRMVLFTDGAANLGDADPQSLAEKIKELRQKGIAFDIAGIAADGLNDELLGELARHGNGRYYVVGKGEDARFAQQLAGAFRPAAENVKVQVHFNPERVGRYKLIGFEKDRLNKEDFRNDAVDAAELAAEEAGVAIYQVETLPEGEGEIGEVSVRFRDVASGQMVERGWTIPHDPSAPALDRAPPSMQLATLAMLAAEKLRGGALADAIQFGEMTEVQAGIMHHFRGDERVAEMMQMIDQLK